MKALTSAEVFDDICNALHMTKEERYGVLSMQVNLEKGSFVEVKTVKHPGKPALNPSLKKPPRPDGARKIKDGIDNIN